MPHKRRDPYATRIVITGIGTINPLANDVPRFWENLMQGKSGVRLAQHTELGDFPVRIAGEVDYPDNLTDFIPKKMVRRLDRFIVFGHVAAAQAFQDSGLEQAQVDEQAHRYGAIIGTGDAGNGKHYETFKQMEANGLESISPFYVIGVIGNTASAYFSKIYNLQGPTFAVSSACATSNHAIGTAATMIKTGLADVMFAGGSEAVANIPGFAGFGVIHALSRRNDAPAQASRPFDRDRDGFVLGEGAGVVCLEELEHAKKRGAHIYAELKGFGFSSDAYDLVAPHPEGRGAAMAMENALENAQLNREDISLINAHGTSTQVGDMGECIALHRAFGEYANKIPVHSTKSMLGHLIAAAGGTEAIAAILALQEGKVHPSINLDNQDERIDLNVIREATEMKVTHVLSNSFGFGGQNATIILSRF